MIRLAQSKDEYQIRECAERAYGRYVPLIGRKPAPMDADYAVQVAAGIVYVSIAGDETFQGFIVFYRNHDHMLLENVAVLPEASGQGVGKALIGFCESEAQRQGCNAVRLYTNEKMSENLSIYPSLGYVEARRCTENGFNRVYFEKTFI